MIMKLYLIAALVIFATVATPQQSVKLAWDRAASHTNLASFVLKHGTSSGSYQTTQRVATNLTTATVSALKPGTTYFFIVTAENVAGLESDPSNEISYRVPITILIDVQSSADLSGPWKSEAIQIQQEALEVQKFFRLKISSP